jgi:hypothetical protein
MSQKHVITATYFNGQEVEESDIPGTDPSTYETKTFNESLEFVTGLIIDPILNTGNKFQNWIIVKVDGKSPVLKDGYPDFFHDIVTKDETKPTIVLPSTDKEKSGDVLDFPKEETIDDFASPLASEKGIVVYMNGVIGKYYARPKTIDFLRGLYTFCYWQIGGPVEGEQTPLETFNLGVQWIRIDGKKIENPHDFCRDLVTNGKN